VGCAHNLVEGVVAVARVWVVKHNLVSSLANSAAKSLPVYFLVHHRFPSSFIGSWTQIPIYFVLLE
jgi:hypothetical protein